MTPFEDLIQELSALMEVTLHPDAHQACLINFPLDDLSVQIDLDTNADKILLGIQLGRITPGAYRERIFLRAMQVNGSAKIPTGILAFSEKNDTLVLFQFLRLEKLTGEKLYNFLQNFRQMAKNWKEALHTGNLPTIEQEPADRASGMFGLRP